MTASFGRLGGDSGGTVTLENAGGPVGAQKADDSQLNLQSRFDEIKNKLSDGDTTNDSSAKTDLWNMQKEAEGYLQAEEAKPGGGDPKAMETLEKLMEEMANLQNGGDGEPEEVKPLQP